MSMQGRITSASGTKVKRALGVQAALEWAFRVEKAQLELPPPQDVVEEGFGFGLEYVLMQRAALGCKVDGGQHKMGSYTHEDAEVIAATVAGIAGFAPVRFPLSQVGIDFLEPAASDHHADDLFRSGAMQPLGQRHREIVRALGCCAEDKALRIGEFGHGGLQL
jgi:hypothetical protein